MADDGLRVAVLAACGARGREVDELLAYGHRPFQHPARPIRLPLDDEPFVATWDRYLAEAAERGVFATLSEHIPQLGFPIREGLSRSPEYRAATRRGAPRVGMASATGLELRHPDRLQLTLHPTAAGRVPLLVTGAREDFVALFRAFTGGNEPTPVPAALGASMIGGFTNWDRVAAHRLAWAAEHPLQNGASAWAVELRRLPLRPQLYQDRFILASDGPYSNVAAAELGLPEAEWARASLAIRREHEAAHYFTRRVLGSMENHLVDELCADYLGIVAATGRYRADWFLCFLGIAEPEHGEARGRLGIYRGEPSLSDGAFQILQRLVARAAHNLERFDTWLRARYGEAARGTAAGGWLLLALTRLSLEEWAADDGDARMAEAWASSSTHFASRNT